jgi:hypothetical protein
MPDTVTTETIFNGRRMKVLHLTNISDGTGEAGVTKLDISTLTFDQGRVPTYSTVEKIEYNIQGFTSVRLFWDHTTDDEIALLSNGTDSIDFCKVGGKTDPRSAGGTGDILLTTAGNTSGATYDIRLYVRPRA